MSSINRKSNQPSFIPYIKYVIAKDTRFERDWKIFFDPNGEVARGKSLVNYGWGPNGFKEMIEALYYAKHGTVDGFEQYYEQNIRNCKGDILVKLRADGLVGESFPAFIRITLKEGTNIPVLLVNIDRVYFKYCGECPQAFENYIHDEFANELENLGMTYLLSNFRCSREICYALCGQEEYKWCVLNYTSTEGEPQVERKKEQCIITRLKQLVKERQNVHLNRKAHGERCLERYVRFDMTPLRYFLLDSKTWSEVEKNRYSKKPRHNFDMVPREILPKYIQQEVDATLLVAPLRSKNVLEHFLSITSVSFEIRYALKKMCPCCGLVHKIENIPIKAMFKDQDVFVQEANFGHLLWEKLWQKYPVEFCEIFQGRTTISSEDSTILKRNFKVKELMVSSPFGECEYDYAVDFRPFGHDRLILFDLTTGLWKKGGFHEESRAPEEYVELWRELLLTVPSTFRNVFAVWYVVIHQREDIFFDETSPFGAKNMYELLRIIAQDHLDVAKIVQSPDDITLRYKLFIVPVFGKESRLELQLLKSKKFDQLLVSKLIDQLFP
jgi:hypothetical protein